MLLSIIIPHFNDANGLVKLIDSIPDVQDVEVIIIDDNSCSIPGFSGRNNVKIYKMAENVGAGACRNLGINKSQGKWLLFADSDDVFAEGFLHTIQSNLRLDKKSYDIIFYSPESVYSDGKMAQRHNVYKVLVEQFVSGTDVESIRYKFVVPWSKLIRKNFIKNNNINFEEIPASNDLMFSVLIGDKAKNITAFTDTIYICTDRQGSLTKVKNKNVIDCRVDAAMRVAAYLGPRSKYATSLSSMIYMYGKDMSLSKLMNLLICALTGKIKLFPR